MTAERRPWRDGVPRSRNVQLDVTVSWAPPEPQPQRFRVIIKDGRIPVTNDSLTPRAIRTVPGVRKHAPPRHADIALFD